MQSSYTKDLYLFMHCNDIWFYMKRYLFLAFVIFNRQSCLSEKLSEFDSLCRV